MWGIGGHQGLCESNRAVGGVRGALEMTGSVGAQQPAGVLGHQWALGLLGV